MSNDIKKQRFISDEALAAFKWPKNMPSFRPKVRKHYEHEIEFTLQNHPDVVFVLQATSEKKGKKAKGVLDEMKNVLSASYVQKEIKPVDKDTNIIIDT